MATSRIAWFGLRSFLPLHHSSNVNKSVCVTFPAKIVYQERFFRKAYGRFLKTMKKRRELAGPDRVRRRNEWDNWNYNAEIYAFNQRLQENMSDKTLRQAFIHEAYVESETQRLKSLELQDVILDLKPNTTLASVGRDVMSNFIFCYLRHCFPYVPEEGISALHDYLLSDEVLSHVSYNLGTSDLIFCSEYPPGQQTLALTLKAIVGVIVTDDNTARGENFVLDFVCPQLIGKDVFDIWDLKDPKTVLDSLLVRHDHQPSEARLIFESGRNSLEAIYHVGLYSDKNFLGRGPGETLSIAQEMASFDALRRLFDLQESKRPLLFGEEARKCNFNSNSPNSMIDKWYREDIKLKLSL